MTRASSTHTGVVSLPSLGPDTASVPALAAAVHNFASESVADLLHRPNLVLVDLGPARARILHALTLYLGGICHEVSAYGEVDLE